MDHRCASRSTRRACSLRCSRCSPASAAGATSRWRPRASRSRRRRTSAASPGAIGVWLRVVKIPSAVTERVTRTARRLPPGIIDELKVSAKQLASVRGPRQLLTLLESEVGRLSGVIVPLLARYPLPVRHPQIAAASAGTAAAVAAAIVSLDELAVLFTEGAAAPTVPGAGVSLLVAF